jgi:hypothetical protein
MAENPNTPQTVGSIRVFISWSGERSKVLAHALKEWLPLVLHNVEPWMSEADIAAGGRWEIEIAKELEVSNFGIICVTRDNVSAPWLLFEAGALAKSLQHSRVIPLLMDLDIKDISGPLARFQAKKMEKAGFGEVIQSINQVANQVVAESRATQLFEALWPKLEEKITAIPKSASSPKPNRSTNEVMEELVAGVRALETRISEIDESPRSKRHFRMRFHPMMFEEMMHMSGDPSDPVAILMAASVMRDDAPWLYELAMEVYRACKTGDPESIEREMKRVHRFANSKMFHGPWMREFGDRELFHMTREFPRILERVLQWTLDRSRETESNEKPSRKRPSKRKPPAE